MWWSFQKPNWSKKGTILALSSPTIRFNRISLLGCTGKPSTSTWTKFDQILTPKPMEWTKIAIVHTIYRLSCDPHGLSTTPPLLLVYVVIECPLNLGYMSTFSVAPSYNRLNLDSTAVLWLVDRWGDRMTMRWKENLVLLPY